MQLRLDGTRVEGSLVHVDGPRPQVAATLRADRIDWDELPSADAAARMRSRLASLDHALELIVERGKIGDHRLSGLALRTRGKDGGLIVEELTVGDMLDASARLSGVLDLDLSVIDLEGEIVMASPARLLRRVGVETPLLMSLIGPIELAGQLDGSSQSLRLLATVASEVIEGEAELVGLPAAFTLDGELRAADTARLLAKLGALVLDQPALAGDGRLGLHWDSRSEERTRGRLDLRLGAMTIDGEIEVPPDEAARLRIEGHGIDGETVSAAYLWLTPVLGLLPGPPQRWIGDWPREAIAWHWPFARGANVASRWLDSEGQMLVEADLELDGSGVALTGLALPLDRGRLEAQAALQPPSLSFSLQLRDAPARQLLRWLDAGSALDGRVDLAVDLAGSGPAPADLVGSLAGEGTIAIGGGRLDAGGETLSFESLRGPVVVERGIAHGRGLLLEQDDRIVPVEVTLDLGAWIVDAVFATKPPLRLVGRPGTAQRARLEAESEPEGVPEGG